MRVVVFQVSLAILAPVLPASGLAQEPVSVPPVRVEAAAPATPPDGPSTDRVDDPADLDAPKGPAAAAAGLPGTRVREAGGPGQPVTVSLRGADSAGTLATLDGVPLNSPFLGGADLSGLALLPVESLTVTRGAASASRGTDAVGGVLDARTPSPFDGPWTSASALYGSFGTARVRAEHAEVGDLAAGLASVGLLASEGDFPFTDANGASRVRSHAAALAIDGLVKVEARPADRHRVEVLAEGFFDDRQVPGMEQFPSATASRRDSRLLASASWSGPAAMGEGGTAGARLFVRRLGFAYGDSSPPMGPPISTSLVSWGFGAEGEVSGLVHPLVSVSAGASAGADFGTVRRSAGGAYDAHRSFVAAAVGVTVGRDAWPVWFAVRLRGEYDPEFADSDDWYRFRGFAPIPAAEVHAEATDWLRFSASASRAFRLPLFEELHFDAGYVKGNPDLLPEDAITWDAGFELGPREDPWLRAAYFENRVFNAILFLPHSAWVTRAENSQDATMRGVEIQAGHRFEHVALAGSYTFLDSRGQGGLAMPQRPRHAASGEVVLELAPVRVIARARFQSSFFLDRFENREEEWRVMLDARAEYEPIPELRLALDFLNLLDKRDAVDALQQPIPGFAVYGSLKVSL